MTQNKGVFTSKTHMFTKNINVNIKGTRLAMKLFLGFCLFYLVDSPQI